MKSLNVFTDNAGIVWETKEKTLLLLMAIFFVTYYLPLSPLVNNIAIVLLAVSCFRFNTWNEKQQLLRDRPAVAFMIIFYLLQVISMVISDDRDKGLQYLQVRVPLLLFPISLGLIYLRSALKIRAYLIYALITTIAAIFCLASALVTYYQTGDSGYMYNDSLSAAIEKQSVYFSLMVNVAIFTYGYLLLKSNLKRNFRVIVVAAIAFLMIIQFMLASRLEIIFLYTATLLFALHYFFIKRKKRRLGFLMLGGLMICVFAFVQFFPKTMNRFNELSYPQFDIRSDAVESHYNMKLAEDQWNGLNIRLAIWSCAYEVIQQSPWLGVGLGDKDQALLKAYEKKGFKFGLRTNKNMHSTYLDIWSGMGLLSLVIFVAGFLVLPFVKSVQVKDLLATIILMDFALSFTTETYPDRSMGCIIFGFFIAFLVSTFEKPGPRHYHSYNVQ